MDFQILYDYFLCANRNRDRVLAGVSERQIMDRLAEKNWRDEGHPLVGQRVRRFLGGDRAANGRIIQWLPAGRYFPLRPRPSTFLNLD